jgi:hypothetical protein
MQSYNTLPIKVRHKILKYLTLRKSQNPDFLENFAGLDNLCRILNTAPYH